MELIDENIWIQHFPLSLLGGHQGRVVTVIRLESGKLLIHSTGPFTGGDLVEYRSLGQPAWMVDSMLRHDTFAKEARVVFPEIPYLVPDGFADADKLNAQSLSLPPPEWSPEIRILRIDGMPAVQEYVFLHVPSRTLIVADLVFNFVPTSGWTSFMRRTLMGVMASPDSARLYPKQIKDRAAYDASIRELMTWDFDRIIVGHNEPVPENGKQLLAEALARKKMLPT